MRYYEPPEDTAGTVFDPYDETFGPVMAAIQAGEFEQAHRLLGMLAGAGDIEKALLAFVETVEATGGVVATAGGPEPVGDRMWLDLGVAYVEACETLGRYPFWDSDDGDPDS